VDTRYSYDGGGYYDWVEEKGVLRKGDGGDDGYSL